MTYEKFFVSDDFTEDERDEYAASWLDSAIKGLKTCSSEFNEERLHDRFPDGTTLDDLASEYIAFRSQKTRTLHLVTNTQEKLPDFQDRWENAIIYILNCSIQSTFEHPKDKSLIPFEVYDFVCEFFEFSDHPTNKINHVIEQGVDTYHSYPDMLKDAGIAYMLLTTKLTILQDEDYKHFFEKMEETLDKVEALDESLSEQCDEIRADGYLAVSQYFQEIVKLNPKLPNIKELKQNADTYLSLAKTYNPKVDMTIYE